MLDASDAPSTEASVAEVMEVMGDAPDAGSDAVDARGDEEVVAREDVSDAASDLLDAAESRDAVESGGAAEVSGMADLTEVSDSAEAAVSPDVLMCASGELACGERCVTPSTDPRNCGACGRDCTVLPHVMADRVSCSAGACVVPASACDVGFLHCTSAVTDGCETPGTTTTNCGLCGNRCGPGAPICTRLGGMHSCFTGCMEDPSTLCSGVCANLLTSVSNCGSCGVVCAAVTNGRPQCRLGACGFDCLAGYHTCSGRCSDNTSAESCGASCLPCSAGPTNSTVTCAAGACGFRCNTGFHACAGVCVSDSSMASCGASCSACAVPVNGAASCDGVRCGFVCNAGFFPAGAACLPPGAPRLVAPLSTSTVTSQRPTLRWQLALGTDGARVEVCRDRGCATLEYSLTVTGASVRVPMPLSQGVHFWRALGRVGANEGTVQSAVWEFFVGALSAPTDTSYGSALDVNCDGYGDVVIGADRQAFVYHGSAVGLLTMPSATVPRPTGSLYEELANVGDLNGDGYGDVVIGGLVFQGSAIGLATTPTTVLSNQLAPAGDVNGDGFADAIVRGSVATEALVYLGYPFTGLSDDLNFGRRRAFFSPSRVDGFAWWGSL